jgi:hypothetical protein
MRWLLAAAVVALTASAAAAQRSALPDQEWAYQTLYEGKIHEMYHQKDTLRDGTPAPRRHETFYSFVTVEVETFRLRKGRVTSQSTLTVYVKGTALQTITEQVGLTNEFVINNYACGIASVPRPIKNTTTFGSTAAPIPAADNPLVQVFWSIPIPLAQNTAGVKWKVAGSKRCTPQGDYSAGAIGRLDQSKVPHAKVDEAYNGNATIRYSQIRNQLAEWSKPFHVHESGATKSASGSPTDAVFDLDSEVSFRALTDPTREPDNKVGGLLLRHAMEALGLSNYNPPADQVLVPGMGAGEVKLEVGATIVPRSNPLRLPAAASKPIVLARGAKRLTRDAPFLMRLTLTPEGKAALAKHKGPLKGTLKLSLKQKGTTTWLTRSQSAVWPDLAP